MPQPLTQVSGRLYFDLESGAAELDWKVYSAAGVLLKEALLPGPFGPGWSWARVTVPDLPNGLFYSVLTARRGADRSNPKKSSFYLLR